MVMLPRAHIALIALAALICVACVSRQPLTPSPSPPPTPEAAAPAVLLTSTPTPTPTPRPATPTPPPPSVDRPALVALYFALNGPSWGPIHNWLSDAPIDEWYGIEADDDGRVVAIYIGVSGRPRIVDGRLPPELGDLANLERLFIYANLIGEIPPELGNLANLKSLGLQNNQLSGEIPPELGNLASLELLDLSNNQFTGPIPPELTNLSNLENLYLSGNQLTGEISEALVNLPSLENLYLINNQFTGEISPDLCRLDSFAVIGNKLTIRGWEFPEWLPSWSICELLQTNPDIDPQVWLEEQLANDEELALWLPTPPPRTPASDWASDPNPTTAQALLDHLLEENLAALENSPLISDQRQASRIRTMLDSPLAHIYKADIMRRTAIEHELHGLTEQAQLIRTLLQATQQ